MLQLEITGIYKHLVFHSIRMHLLFDNCHVCFWKLNVPPTHHKGKDDCTSFEAPLPIQRVYNQYFVEKLPTQRRQIDIHINTDVHTHIILE